MNKAEIRAAIAEATKPSLPDRLVNWISPVRGRQRTKARVRMAMARAYDVESKSRRPLSEWIANIGDADTVILQDLPTLRERSRDLTRNNALAVGAINTKVTNIVGTGLRLKASIDRDALGMTDEQANEWEAAAEREWKLWSESQECDIERTLRFTDIQSLALRSVLENGDVFILLPMVERAGNPYELKVQMIEADRISNPDRVSDTEKIAGGVGRDETGAPLRYYIADTHPGNYIQPKAVKWDTREAFGETGRRNVLHLYNKIRIGQTRGVPDMAPVMELLKQLGRYTDAEIMAAVMSGMFTVFIKSESGEESLGTMQIDSDTAGSGTTDPDYKMGYGAMLELKNSESVEFADPKRPNQAFDPFVLAIMRQIGVALELPFELLVKHFTASYSAARAALLEAWKFFSARRQWLAMNLCQPVYEAVIEEAVLKGRLQAPGFVNGDPLIRKAYLGAEWIGPARGQIDELKEVKASRERVDGGFSTESRETAMMTGNDWERDHKQRVRERQVKEADGLMPLPAPAAPDEPEQPDNNGSDLETE